MNTKNTLAIRLTEPIIFLHPTSSGPHENDTAATLGSSLLRGLLRLTLTKPMRISGIEIELLGKSCTVRDEGGRFPAYMRTHSLSNKYPQLLIGLGSSRAEIKEEHEVYHASTVFFDTNKTVNQAGSGWKDFTKGKGSCSKDHPYCSLQRTPQIRRV
jgi:arrestin-related trafficking adapter 3/6